MHDSMHHKAFIDLGFDSADASKKADEDLNYSHVNVKAELTISIRSFKHIFSRFFS